MSRYGWYHKGSLKVYWSHFPRLNIRETLLNTILQRGVGEYPWDPCSGLSYAIKCIVHKVLPFSQRKTMWLWDSMKSMFPEWSERKLLRHVLTIWELHIVHTHRKTDYWYAVVSFFVCDCTVVHTSLSLSGKQFVFPLFSFSWHS